MFIFMNEMKILKALGNEKRLEILRWLKTPEQHFPPHQEVENFDNGVCVSYIQDKSALTQSTISQYLTLMQNAELVIPTRIGKWSYYRRNEKIIAEFSKHIKDKL